MQEARRWLNLKPETWNLKRQGREARRGRLRARDVALNLPLLLGTLIVAALFAVVLFGPLWAPENPYLVGTRGLLLVDGELTSPPWPPSEKQPLGSDQWGRDILSLLLYGTRNTLVACTFITMARLILGLLLGAIAGWNEGTLADRTIMGAIGVTTSLPLLLTGMILIFALDIRRGISVFIVALCLLGWGEIAQYIRSEFLSLRQRPFIEGARAVGLRGVSIAVRHILPNILPQLIVLGLLEMGAVLMALGELGFVGVFMGGGTRQENSLERLVTIPDIPEWGAMMADSRLWARAKPWMVFYPALAFFIAVVGFNALGEGLRRLIERAAVSTAFLLSKRMLVVVAVVTAATVYIVNNVGPAPSYARLASTFDVEKAMEHVRALAQMRGRRAGSAEGEAAADYIAARFQEYGLQTGGSSLSYFHSFNTRLVEPVEQPELALLAADGSVQRRFQHQVEFGFRIEGHGGSGHAEAPLALVGFSPYRQVWPWEAFKGMDLREHIVLALEGNAPPDFPTEALIRGAKGVLLVVEDPHEVRSHVQLADPARDTLRRPTLPILAITPAVADAFLQADGLSVAAVRERLEALRAERSPEWFVEELQSRARLHVALSEPREVTLRSVLGHWTGQDVVLDEEMIIVAAHYDGLGSDPDGTLYPAVNDGASGVATLLEIARLWHEAGYEPRRTVLFAAWAGGELTRSGAQAYFEGYGGGLSLLDTVAVLQLDRLGAGGDMLEISSEPRRLSDLLADAAGRLGVSVERGKPVSHPYQQIVNLRAPAAVIRWADSEVDPRLDTLIDRRKLQAAGEVINLALITISREAAW
ncbi:MAG: M28 family peptidase [Anaerolineae bacterium]|nr:M28 family peptidase [Anaerolineae bacterium]